MTREDHNRLVERLLEFQRAWVALCTESVWLGISRDASERELGEGLAAQLDDVEPRIIEMQDLVYNFTRGE